MPRFAFLLICVVTALSACDTVPTVYGDRIDVYADGRLERGGVVSVRVHRAGVPQEPGLFDVIADPASAVQWLSPTTARLVRTGTVRFIARVGLYGGTGTFEVTLPPSVLFESVQGGNRDIRRVALDGEDLMRLSDDPAEERSPSSAQGQVYFVSSRVNPAAVYVAPATPGPAERVTSGSLEFTGAVISPDGTRLAFTRGVGGVAKVWVSARDGSGARRVSTSGGGVIEIAPAWSHDGSRIAFVSTLNSDADIFHVAAAGGEPQLAAGGAGADIEPSWSPDGQRIVFARGPDGQLDLHVVTLATGNIAPLTTTAGNEARPTWLSDGRIVFARGPLLDELAWLDPAAPAVVTAIPVSAPVSGRTAELR